MENTWQLKRIKRIQEKLGKTYIKEFQDRLYISFDDLLELLGDLEDNYSYLEEKLEEVDREVNK